MTNIHGISFFETCSSIFQKNLAGGVFCITDLQNENCNKGNLLIPLGCFSMRDSVNAQSIFRGLSYRTVGDVCAQDFSIQTQNLWKVWLPFCNGIAITKESILKLPKVSGRILEVIRNLATFWL